MRVSFLYRVRLAAAWDIISGVRHGAAGVGVRLVGVPVLSAQLKRLGVRAGGVQISHHCVLHLPKQL